MNSANKLKNKTDGRDSKPLFFGKRWKSRFFWYFFLLFAPYPPSLRLSLFSASSMLDFHGTASALRQTDRQTDREKEEKKNATLVRFRFFRTNRS
jgi:hypothetical protein